jgi:hypothetical protein
MSFNQLSQTLEEMVIIDHFKNSYVGFPNGKLVKSESPDFIIWENPKTAIGIELTKLHGPTIHKIKTHYPRKVSGYQAPEFNRDNIEYTINAKIEKLLLYRQKKLRQIWLLITADLDESPAPFNFRNKLNNWTFPPGFNKVFLLELKNREVYELLLSPNS